MFFKTFIIIFIFIKLLPAQNIKVGMTADLSGPIETLGNGMKIGIESYFFKYNKKLNSQKTFSLITYDDKYNSIQASKNVIKLISQDKIVSFLGNLGTPTANVTLPLINDKKMALVGAYTGSMLLRKKTADKNVFNYRVSYSLEAKYIIKQLLKNGIKPKDIVFFSQNDAYGNTAYLGALDELKNNGYKNARKLPHGRYNSHSSNVESGLSKLLNINSNPKVIIMFATTNPIIKFMKLAKKDFPNALFISISPVSRYKIINKLGDLSENMIITQTVPLLDSNLSIVNEFLTDVEEFFPSYSPTLATLEGYIVGKLFVQSLIQSNQKIINRTNIISLLSNAKDIDIGLGFTSDFNKTYNQYSSKIWTSIIKNKKLTDFNWNEVRNK